MVFAVITVLIIAGCGGTNMKISSSAFEHKGRIPDKYTCIGDDVNPPLEISNIPKGTKTLALIIDDPDAPVGTWVHWVVWNINLSGGIMEDSVPGTQGSNDFRKIEYGGPCPPSGTHRYFFKLYALDSELALEEGSDKKKLLATMEGHVISQAELIGLYSK